jgi:hypothetical protein
MDNKYTKEQYEQVKNDYTAVGARLTDGALAGRIWSYYKTISGNTTEPQPCLCGSSSGLWSKAVTVVRDYINQQDAINNTTGE